MRGRQGRKPRPLGLRSLSLLSVCFRARPQPGAAAPSCGPLGGAEEPAWLQGLRKDSSPPGPQPSALCCPQDGRLGTGRPAMRDYCPSPLKASVVPPRHTPAHSPGMDSRHSSPSGAGGGAFCSEGPGGSLACPPLTCIPPQEAATEETVGTHGASISGTPEVTFSGKPEPVSSAKTDPSSLDNRNPMFSEKMDSKSSKQADSTSAGKEDARPLRKADPTFIGKVEPAVLGKGDPVASGRMDPGAPREEDPGSWGEGDPACLSKVDQASPRMGDPAPSATVEPALPRQEEPRYLGQKLPGSSEEAGSAPAGKADLGPSGKRDPGPSGKVHPGSSENTESASTGKAGPGSAGMLTPGASGRIKPTSPGTVAPGSAAGDRLLEMTGPVPVGTVETVSPAKEGPPPVGAMGVAASGKGDPASVGMTRTGSAGQAAAVSLSAVGPASLGKGDPTSSGKPEPRSPGKGELTAAGETEIVATGKEHPLSSRKVGPVSVVGNIKTSSSGNMDPGSSGKMDPVPSVPGDPKLLGTVGSSSSVKAEAVTGDGAAPLSSEKAGPVTSGKAGPTASGRADPPTLGKVDPVSGGKAEIVPLGKAADSVSSGKVAPMTLGKTVLAPSGKADAVPEEKVDALPPEKGNPENSTKVDPSASGKAEPKSQGKAVTKPPEQEGPNSTGKAEAATLQEKPLALEKGDPGSSGKADPVASGKVEPVALGRANSPPPRGKAEAAVPLTLDQAEVSLPRQSDSKACGSAYSPSGAGSRGDRVELAPATSTEVCSLGQKEPVAAGAQRSPGPEAEAPPPGPRTRDNFTKAPSWDASALPPREDAGTQAGAQPCVSVAVSPMSPQDGSGGPAFSFQAAPREPSPAPRQPSRRDAGLQVSMGAAETRSVATGPMTPQATVPPAAPPAFPEVRVRPGSVLAAAVAPPEAAEPVRDVSWDEKGMTWEVYGAAMEVEVLGMAIQKHLERQIEEHGRQGAPAPPPAARPGPGRAGSVRTAPPEGNAKRPPGLFRALLQSVRRPRCCSRAGPTAE